MSYGPPTIEHLHHEVEALNRTVTSIDEQLSRLLAENTTLREIAAKASALVEFLDDIGMRDNSKVKALKAIIEHDGKAGGK